MAGIAACMRARCASLSGMDLCIQLIGCNADVCFAQPALPLQVKASGDDDMLNFIETISQRKFTVEEAKQAKEAFMVGSNTMVSMDPAMSAALTTSCYPNMAS